MGSLKNTSSISSQNLLAELRGLTNPNNVAGMRRFGIQGGKMLGIPIPVLRKMAKKAGKDAKLAEALWDSGYHEARILAGYVMPADQVTPTVMEAWVKTFDSWDVCDQVCGSLFDKTPRAYETAVAWSLRDEEFVKRAGFALMACLAWHDKSARDSKFEPFFKRILAESTDGRNFVKKAVNWALRQIGKRNPALRKKAIQTAKRILKTHPESKAARFVAKNALAELSQS